jgi:hypothetical protein
MNMIRRILTIGAFLVAAAVAAVYAAPWAKTYSLRASTVAVTNGQANTVWTPVAVLWSFPQATTATVTVTRTSQGNTYLLGQVAVSNSSGVIWVSEADYPFEYGDVLTVTSTDTNGAVEIIRKGN